MIHQQCPYGIGVKVRLPYDQAVAATRDALGNEGFGVLTEIDVAATLKKKLGVDFPPYIILGACNPPLAHRALNADIEIGLLLPCNVVVRAGDDAGESVVTAMDPEVAMELTGSAEVRSVAHDAKQRLQRALESLE